MSYVVFARKYRPQTFDEVVGQDHVAQTLRNAIAGDRLAHAYLMCGPRGVGKTTMARLLAKAVNCLVSPGISPCGTCDACVAIAAGQDIDVLELDAASRRKVEDVEPLIDSSRYLPQRSPKKVFIVDEAHMLSKTAWNALLKTLEEPPPHVLFIFATTEPSKVIETVRSRCQRFDFRRITEIDIVGKLRRIVDTEGARVDDEVLAEIASRATGGLRDAETLLDQAISSAPADRSLQADDLVAILGGTPRGLRFDLLGAARAGDMAATLQGATELVDAGADPVELLHDLFADVHRCAISCARGESLPDSMANVGVEWCLAAADLLSRHKRLARDSRSARASLDLGLLAISRLGDVRDLEELVTRLEAIGGGAADSSDFSSGSAPTPPAPQSPASKTPVPQTPVPSTPPVAAPPTDSAPAVPASPRLQLPGAKVDAAAPAASSPSRALSPSVAPRQDASNADLPELGSASPAQPSDNGGQASGNIGDSSDASQNTDASRFSTEEMHEIRSHPQVREVLDTFRGRIENVKREQPFNDG